jgi:hypothetical protein
MEKLIQPEAVDADRLKLVVDHHGIVWFAEGADSPRNSGFNVQDYIAQADNLRAVSGIRVIGTHENSELLLRLYRMRSAGQFPILEVCSPLCCEPAAQRKDPEVVLYKMRNFPVARSVGGWHEFDASDVKSYLLALHYQKGLTITETQQAVLREHRMWLPLSFIHDIDIEACCTLVGLLIDPRWYVSRTEPDSEGKLEQFLGLSTSIQSGAEKGQGKLHDRCRLVQKCWRRRGAPRCNPEDPRQFLWRMWNEKGGGARADLFISKKFVSFLKAVWTDALAPESRRGRLMVSKHWFSEPRDAEAFDQYTQAGAC